MNTRHLSCVFLLLTVNATTHLSADDELKSLYSSLLNAASIEFDDSQLRQPGQLSGPGNQADAPAADSQSNQPTDRPATDHAGNPNAPLIEQPAGREDKGPDAARGPSPDAVRESQPGPQSPYERLPSVPAAAPQTAPRPAGPTEKATTPTRVAAPAHRAAAWWDTQVAQQMWDGQAVTVDINSLITGALLQSAQIAAFRQKPLIQEQAITEADAAFDWTAYAESFWNDTDEPVGSTLMTGGSSRYKDHHLTGKLGVRRRTLSGGSVDISQQLGHQSNNSVFFVPADQGTARLTLSYTQPLMRGAGKVYNTSMTVLASLDTSMSHDELSRQLQSHLLEVVRAYWGLYLERAALAQRVRLFQKTQSVVESLQARRELDAQNAQLVRAKAALADRRAELIRAEAAVKNAEARIRALVNDPGLGKAAQLELIPNERPVQQSIPVDMEYHLSSALQQRPEIAQAMKRIKASCVRMNLAKQDILPQLDLVARTYLSGLRGDSAIGDAWVDQFHEGAPSYSVGLQYQRPFGNRAAKARLQRRRLEVRQLQHQFRATTETLKMEVEVAAREVITAHAEMRAKQQAMHAAQQEQEFITTRWQGISGKDDNGSLMMDNLLRAQERLTEAEYEYLNAQLTYNLAIINLKRADGSLLQSQQISATRHCECNLPGLEFQQAGAQADGPFAVEVRPPAR